MSEKIKYHLRNMKPLDIVVIVCLFIASFIPHIVYGIQLGNIDDDAVIIATVRVSGEELYRVELSEETPHEEFRLEPGEGKYNIIEVEGTRIRNREDNSPDQLGVRRGWISQPGETAVVLPHQLIIEIHAENQDGQEIYEEEDIIIPM
ncbi:hypothetical protein ADIAL_1062 [Alkalibacterium sp. AK22]|uniref:NusG domain II-containing protein n=1 Tax=Alkalibacterium sp. AK22 TaxID=1229520 RepID=UPI00045142D6|nr:NusG domain II-containing protein [Alkalibacterium sp. AK22]EXJ23450.1 hypothetical protein ADIAL_1062 [Alkalibacterium sp. AK22]